MLIDTDSWKRLLLECQAPPIVYHEAAIEIIPDTSVRSEWYRAVDDVQCYAKRMDAVDALRQ